MDFEKTISTISLEDFPLFFKENIYNAQHIISAIIKNKRIELLSYIKEEYTSIYKNNILELVKEAAREGYKEGFDFIIKDIPTSLYLETTILQSAILGANIEMVKYLVDEKNFSPYAGNGLLVYLAVVSNSLEVTKFLVKEKGCEARNYLLDSLKLALRNKNWEILKLLLSNEKVYKSVWEEDLLKCSIETGNFEGLKFLVKECGAEPKKHKYIIMSKAVLYESVETLRFLVEECGCDPHELEEQGLKLACYYGHLDKVKLLVEKYNCDLGKVVINTRIKNIQTALFIVSKGYWNASFDNLIKLSDIKAAKEYYEQSIFLNTIFQNTTKKNKRDFVSKLLKEKQQEQKNLIKNTI